MSDDPRFERDARAWLELGPTDVPDRVVEAALLTIDKTSQERDFRVPWRLPNMTLATRSAAVAVVAVVALGAIVAIGRTAPVGTNEPTPSPAATASAVPTGMTVAAFKLARDAICTEAQSTNARLAPRYRKIIDPAATAAEFTDGIAALGDFVTLSSQTTDQLAQLAVPPGLEQGQAVNLAQYRDIVAILQHELELLNAGEFADAKAVDLSTDAISRQISAWEAEYGFLNCP